MYTCIAYCRCMRTHNLSFSFTFLNGTKMYVHTHKHTRVHTHLVKLKGWAVIINCLATS